MCYTIHENEPLVDTLSVSQLLFEGKTNALGITKLDIPDYQRPYKWTQKNVTDLLEDMLTAIENRKKYPNEEYKYRIGTVILHNDKNIHNIVDGQQRLVTLTLILSILYKDTAQKYRLANAKFSNPISKNNI